MTAAALVLTVALAVVLLVLLRRLAFAAGELRAACRGWPRSPFLVELARALARHADQSLLGGHRGTWLAALPVPFTPPGGPHPTAAGLLATLGGRSEPRDLRELTGLLGDLYRLQAALRLEDDALDRVLERVLAGVAGISFMGRPLGRARLVRPGELLDRRAMWPVTAGGRVRQPLGAVLYDEDGRVASRAPVVCA